MRDSEVQRARQEARRLGQMLGGAAALLALMQVAVASSGAAFNEASVLSLQHALADISTGGGARLTPAFPNLLRLWVVSYGTAFCSFIVTLGLSWYAGRTAALTTRQRQVGTVAGYWVMLLGGLAWITASALAVLVFHADGTISWLLATVVDVLVTPQNAPVHGIYVTQPSPLFLALQLVILLLHQVIGLVFALGGGALAGQIGAQSASLDDRSASVARLERRA